MDEEIGKEKAPGEVVNLKTERKKRSKDDKVKLKVSEAEHLLAEAIMRSPLSRLPPFPLRLGVVEPEKGARLPYILHDDNTVEIVRLEYVRDQLLSYVSGPLGALPDFLLGHRQAADAAAIWLSRAPATPEANIKMVRWADEIGLTYRRLPWAFHPGSPVPTWEALLSRMSNVQAFIDWVGSLLVGESSLQNYVWLYGVGGDGKGSINRFLARVFERSYRSKQPPRPGDKFWTYGLLGARLVVFPDCDDHKFVSGGLFKSLTGGDPVDVEAKGQMSFTSRLGAKYLVISNEKPSISSERADLRRIIYCELGKAEIFDHQFEEKLWEEGGAFLAACLAQYLDKYPTHKPIVSDNELAEDWVSTLEETEEVIFEKWFAVDPASHVLPGDMSRVLEIEFPRRRRDQRAFRTWLERTHGVRKKRVRIDPESSQWRYQGVRLKQTPVAQKSSFYDDFEECSH